MLELEKTLEVERVRLGELRKQHYALAGAVGPPSEEEPSQPTAAPRGASRKPPLAQKPSVAPRQDQQVQGGSAGVGGHAEGSRPCPLISRLTPQLDGKDGLYPVQLVN